MVFCLIFAKNLNDNNNAKILNIMTTLEIQNQIQNLINKMSNEDVLNKLESLKTEPILDIERAMISRDLLNAEVLKRNINN